MTHCIIRVKAGWNDLELLPSTFKVQPGGPPSSCILEQEPLESRCWWGSLSDEDEAETGRRKVAGSDSEWQSDRKALRLKAHGTEAHRLVAGK